MGGVITARDVCEHAALIVELFGWGVFFRALRACFSGESTTFLACLDPVGAR